MCTKFDIYVFITLSNPAVWPDRALLEKLNTEYMYLYVFGAKLGKCLVNLTFIPVFKPHTHKLYTCILRHYTNIVYIFDIIICIGVL